MNINNIFSIFMMSCMIVALSADTYAMDRDEWAAHKSKSLSSYSTTQGNFQGFISAFSHQGALQFALDEDDDADGYFDDMSQDEGDVLDVIDNPQSERTPFSPCFSEISLVLHKTDKEFLNNLLRSGQGYRKLDSFFDDLSNVVQDNQQNLVEISLQIFIDAVDRLDCLTQAQWRDVLEQAEREKEALKKEKRKGKKAKKRTPLPVSEISSDRWKSQKCLMARQLNVIVTKIFTALNLPSSDIKKYINDYQSDLATTQLLSSSWNSCSVPRSFSLDD